mgnify:FL=1
MLVLVNANRMSPPIAPIGLDYVASAARARGIPVEIVDLALAADPDGALERAFARGAPRLVGVSFRNVDDSFWPSAAWFVPELDRLIARLRALTTAPIVLGGVGLSIFADRLVARTGADFAVRGDGEGALAALYAALDAGPAALAAVPGLIHRAAGGALVQNPPAWPSPLVVPADRDAIDNRAYFARGGQLGVETKRGCPRRCIYCADPLAKGPHVRARDPREVAEEVAGLAARGLDVLHLCDGEFNVPGAHAAAVCAALAARGLGERVRWYAYAAVRPFDDTLALAMRRAGCVGVDFTGDAGSDAMLAAYRHPHRRAHLEAAVAACRRAGLTCMVDLLLGGPGETPATVRETIDALRGAAPDCVGVALGMRLYPGTRALELARAEGPLEANPSIRRRGQGPVDLLEPVYYLARALGPTPAALVREQVGDDPRFFVPAEEAGRAGDDHNYNDHAPLLAAIARGERGAYWDILRRLGPARG